MQTCQKLFTKMLAFNDWVMAASAHAQQPDSPLSLAFARLRDGKVSKDAGCAEITAALRAEIQERLPELTPAQRGEFLQFQAWRLEEEILQAAQASSVQAELQFHQAA